MGLSVSSTDVEFRVSEVSSRLPFWAYLRLENDRGWQSGDRVVLSGCVKMQ